MKRTFLFGLVSILIILTIVMGACGKTTLTTTTTQGTTTTTTQITTATSTQTATTTTSIAPLKTLKFGALISLNTGQYIQAKKWFELYAKLVNDAGGWQIGQDKYKLEWVIYDIQSGPAAAKDALTRLVLQDNVKYIFGATGTSAVDVTITDPNHVIVMGSDFTNDSAMPEVQYYYTTGNFFTNALQYKIESHMLDKGFKTYVSVKPDSQIGHFADMQLDGSWKLAAPSVQKLGVVFVDPTTVDFGPVGTKIASYNADVIDLNYLGMIPNSVPQVYRALFDIGSTAVILPGIMSPNDLANIVTVVGKEFVEGGEVFSQDPTGYQNDPRMLAYFDAYAEEYGKFEVENTGALGPVFVIEDAINATQSIDVEVIKAYLDKMDHPVRGPLGWTGLFARPDLNNFRTICGGWSHPVQRITDGKLVNIDVVTLKEQYLFSVMSNNLVEIYKAYWEEYGYPKFPEEEEAATTLKFSDLGISGQD